MQDIFIITGTVTVGFLFVDLLLEYISYKKRKRSHEEGRFLQWV